MRCARRARRRSNAARQPSAGLPGMRCGGECELQDMTFSYGARNRSSSRPKSSEEKQWSPVVYFDRPRCILCYRCVRVCGEGMDVWRSARRTAASVRSSRQIITTISTAKNAHVHRPSGRRAYSGAYRYKTRPWEMNHVGTICTHCGDGSRPRRACAAATRGWRLSAATTATRAGLTAISFAFQKTQRKSPLIPLLSRLSPRTISIPVSQRRTPSVVLQPSPQCVQIVPTWFISHGRVL